VMRATLPGTGNAYGSREPGRSCGEPESRRAVATRGKEWVAASSEGLQLKVRANPTRKCASTISPDRQGVEGARAGRPLSGPLQVGGKLCIWI
jgi:hypothetical protein